MTKVSDIVKKYRTQAGNSRPLPLRQFADLLSEVPNSVHVSHATIAMWESGTVPLTGTLILLAEFATDWRRDFANECLDVLAPRWRPSQPPAPTAPTQAKGKRQ